MSDRKQCPDCQDGAAPFGRREFLKVAGTAAVAASALPSAVEAAVGKKAAPETHVKKLFKTLSDKQRKVICFDWDHTEDKRGLLRTRISNNWHITKPAIESKFYSDEQRDMIRAIFEGLYDPEWVPRIEKQLKDDAGGYGKAQNIAIFGDPDDGKFEFVMTGRHLTIRCDGNSADHVAFAGPIFYGHAAEGFNEKADHPGNVFWPQALEANKLFKMLDGKQRKAALIARTPAESAVGFRGPQGKFPGIPVSELASDQKAHLQKVLQKLIEPYRKADQQEAMQCLKAQGGLDKCSLAFYLQGDIGDDGVWDNWRLEGPSFVWYFRGSPHVHVWVNVADNASVKLNA